MIRNKSGQFFIISILVLGFATFLLATYSLSIGESSAVMFEQESRIELKNLENSVGDSGNCNGNVSLCGHFREIYGGRFDLSCSPIGDSAPYNYSVSITSKDLEISANFTQELNCGCTDSDGDSYNTTSGSGCGASADVDCNDSDVTINPGVVEVCDNDIDDNCDGNTDCGDSTCDGQDGGGFVCEYGNELTCDDGYDNDRDGFTDGDDSDCGGGGGG